MATLHVALTCTLSPHLSPLLALGVRVDADFTAVPSGGVEILPNNVSSFPDAQPSLDRASSPFKIHIP